MTTNLGLVTVPTTREELADQMEADGYAVGRPAHVSRECIANDQQTANETMCDICGNHGLEFAPFKPQDRRQLRGYRCLAWCPVCDAAFEF